MFFYCDIPETLFLQQIATCEYGMSSSEDESNSTSNIRPWSLSNVPGYAGARILESVCASELTEAQFRREYVAKLRPVRIMGAVKHWPAWGRWHSNEYLLSSIGADTLVGVRTHPMIESERLEEWREQNRVTRIEINFREFLQRATTETSNHLVLHSYSLTNSPIDSIGSDVEAFSFLARVEGGRLYPPRRAFMYSTSFTDWHYHSADETLMCQVVGSKEVLLLPPDKTSWQILAPILHENGRTFDGDFSKRFEGANLIRTNVEPGDALYIPVFWWHAVGCDDVGKLGATVACTFPTALAINADLRFVAARKTVMQALRSKFAPLAIIGIIWWLISRLIPELLHLKTRIYR